MPNWLEKEKTHSPQSLFGPEEVKAGFLHVHLNDNNLTQSSTEEWQNGWRKVKTILQHSPPAAPSACVPSRLWDQTRYQEERKDKQHKINDATLE